MADVGIAEVGLDVGRAKARLWAHLRGKERQQLREIIGGNSLTSGPPLDAHFGLGDATNVTSFRIEWPSGVVQELHNVTPKQYLTIWEPPALKLVGQENGACRFTVTAEPNRTLRIEASTGQKTWKELATVNNATATFAYSDTASAHMAFSSYRVVAE